jgi:hypothetical protein
MSFFSQPKFEEKQLVRLTVECQGVPAGTVGRVHQLLPKGVRVQFDLSRLNIRSEDGLRILSRFMSCPPRALESLNPEEIESYGGWTYPDTSTNWLNDLLDNLWKVEVELSQLQRQGYVNSGITSALELVVASERLAKEHV